MTRGRRGSVALAVVGALLLTGCGDDDESQRLPRTQTSASSTSGDDESAEKHAAIRVHQFIDGTNKTRQEPGIFRDPSTIGYADSVPSKEMIAASLELEDEGRKQEGTVVLQGEPTVTEVDLNPDRKDGEVVNPFVEFRACVDASDTHLVDAKGKKVAKSEGKGPHPMKFRVINRHWPSNAGWRVAWEEPIKGSC